MNNKELQQRAPTGDYYRRVCCSMTEKAIGRQKWYMRYKKPAKQNPTYDLATFRRQFQMRQELYLQIEARLPVEQYC